MGKPLGQWLEHKGGRRPVSANTLVRIQCRSEKREFADLMAAEPASEFVWKYDVQPGPGDIVFYMIVEERP